MAALGMLTVGCGGSDTSENDAKPSADSTATQDAKQNDDSASQVEGEQLPVKLEGPVADLITTMPTVSPSPDRSATTTEKVLYELQRRTLRMAGITGETSGECDGGELVMKAGATTACTITYESVKVPWEVTISDSYKPGSIIFSYEAKPLKGVVTAQGVYGAFWKQQNSYSEDLRCSEVPKAELVELDQATAYKCQYLIKDSSGNRWSDRSVKVSERGVQFSPVR
ncbi:hypothetical protein [Streptomyces sp. NPDC018693]|uniref:hypothetical protein n=1 Tax=unclassified Streptomyces TaxID=2593676 RepID=UPI0037AE176B